MDVCVRACNRSCLGGRGNDLGGLTWRTFLNRSEHHPDTPWPVDAVAFHLYTLLWGTRPDGTHLPEPPQSEWPALIWKTMAPMIKEATEATRVIKAVSPTTLVHMNEVGICNTCAQSVKWQDMDSTLGSGPNASWWNVQSVTWVMLVGELGAAGVDLIGASQFLGWPTGPNTAPDDYKDYIGMPVGVPSSSNKMLGSPFQPQVTADGNCPEMSMISWKDGTGNARFWAIKMIIDGMGGGSKNIYNAAVHGSPVYAKAFSPAATKDGGDGTDGDDDGATGAFALPTAWPGKSRRAVLLANKDTLATRAVSVPGLQGGQ